MGAVIVAAIAVLIALGCLIAITMADFGGKKKKKELPGKERPGEKPDDQPK